ncbi:hypothetical protein D1B31_05155 [Neobacillus notoginsengisoli]|uniref:Uncharacterized protein n=1 Tax=Neobacillus notoginsengisoli TaxID=1578198 RepID=A0A417YX77_9BACI|nr:hypothetical protein [Neobacillus notoginsengisoli]RHW42032.1 hypothetical protein D1B31_05155 [Neobacillus notoginsengisoli]
MRNVRYLIQNDYSAEEIAEALKLQLEINRYENVSITAVERRNEVIIQIPEDNENLEETLGSFMAGYQDGVILE